MYKNSSVKLSLAESRLTAVNDNDYQIQVLDNVAPNGDDLYKVVYDARFEGMEEPQEEIHRVIPEDDVPRLLVTLCLRSCYLPITEKVTLSMLAKDHPTLFWSIVSRSDNDAKNIPLESVLTEIFPGDENWSHLSQQGARQRTQAPHNADPPCNELAQLERGSSEDESVAEVLMQCYDFNDSNDVQCHETSISNDTNRAWPVFYSCAFPLKEKNHTLE